MGKWLAILGAVAMTCLSAYGWWFHFAVGPAHGPGLELGVIGAALAAGAAWLAIRLDRLDS